MNVLEVEALRYSVRTHFWSRRKPILQGVDLAVGRGEIFGFLGPNGAGKTTTIKAVLGLLTPESGAVRLFGKPIGDPTLRSRVGFMPERAYFPEHLTGRELLTMHGALAGMQLGGARRRADELLEHVGLGKARHERLGGYSKGMLQRAAFGQALIASPDLVILDEPMSGLDPMGRHDFRKMMLALRDAGATVFFSTHILPDVETLCDRVAIMVGGTVRRIAPMRELLGGTDAAVEIATDACSEAIATSLSPLVTRQRAQGGGAFVFEAKNVEAANLVIDKLRAANVRVVDMSTRRRSLEEIFVDEARTGDTR